MVSDTITLWSSDKQTFEVPHEVACMSEVCTRHWPGCMLCVCLQNTIKLCCLLQTIAQMVGDMEEADMVGTCLVSSASECIVINDLHLSMRLAGASAKCPRHC